MASVAIEPRISGKLVYAVRKNLNCFTKAAEITQSPSQPDDRLRIVRIYFIPDPGLL
jgi:hypothetical protein